MGINPETLKGPVGGRACYTAGHEAPGAAPMITQQRTIVLNLERPIQICAEVAREGTDDPNPLVVILHTSCEGKEVVLTPDERDHAMRVLRSMAL